MKQTVNQNQFLSLLNTSNEGKVLRQSAINIHRHIQNDYANEYMNEYTRLSFTYYKRGNFVYWCIFIPVTNTSKLRYNIVTSNTNELGVMFNSCSEADKGLGENTTELTNTFRRIISKVYNSL